MSELLTIGELAQRAGVTTSACATTTSSASCGPPSASLGRLPFDGAANDDRWMQLTFCANDLLCWARRISLVGPLRRATPRTIRHRLLHIAAHTSPRRLRLDASWPWTNDLLNAIDHVKTRLQPPPPTVPIRPAIHPGL